MDLLQGILLAHANWKNNNWKQTGVIYEIY
jgi:hypothetical protein